MDLFKHKTLKEQKRDFDNIVGVPFYHPQAKEKLVAKLDELSSECEEEIQKETTATNRIILDEKGKCIKCGKTGIKAYFAKAY